MLHVTPFWLYSLPELNVKYSDIQHKIRTKIKIKLPVKLSILLRVSVFENFYNMTFIV